MEMRAGARWFLGPLFEGKWGRSAGKMQEGAGLVLWGHGMLSTSLGAWGLTRLLLGMEIRKGRCTYVQLKVF